jgi:phenylalanyl-tRNA synthetase beta chain
LKVPFKWLGEYVDLSGVTPQGLADRLNAVGVLVENVENRNQGITNVVVGRIEEISQHPNADRLRVCQVEVGRPERLQIVTGAPNVAEGNCVPVALEGANLAGGLKIKRSKLRGLESMGMMCSADELAISIKDLPADQREGVLIFPPDTPPGADVLELLGIDEVVLHLEPFANRPDSLSMIGIAREVSAALGRALKPIAHDCEETGAEASAQIAVRIDDRSLCPRYTARVIEGVKVGASPLWMAGRLQAAGMRSVNNVVDITNYVMLESGQPLHAFDLENIEGGRIEVRAARAGEKMMSLDGVERQLDERMLVIADGARPVAIAGVMGGLDSEVSDATTRVLLESASFNPASVRRTSTRLALRSESSRRFEKGLDWHGVDAASRRACHLLEKYCGGRVSRGVAEDGVAAPEAARVSVRPSRVARILGTAIPEPQIASILRGLQFHVDAESAERIEVTVPTWRPDVRREEDLIEEVARHYGYDNIPARLPGGVTYHGRTSEIDRDEEEIRDILVELGLFEAITLSLLHPIKYERIAMRSTGDVKVVNPLVADQAQIRTTLLPHLIESVMHNLNARAEHVELFEISKVYRQGETARSVPTEQRRLAVVVAGRKNGRPLDFYHAMGVVQGLFRRLRIPIKGEPFESEAPSTFHPGKTARLRMVGGGAETNLGVIGALHPAVLEVLDTETEIVAAELDLDLILSVLREQGWVQYRPISRFPEVSRDLALVVADEVPSGRIEEEMWRSAASSLVSVRCFDVYRGKQIDEGHKSMAYSLTFQQPDRTLTDADIEKLMSGIVERLQTAVGARVRA